MARTEPVDYNVRPLKDVSLEDLREWVYDEYKTVLADSDKAGDVEDAAYWEGCVEAYTIVLLWLTEGERGYSDEQKARWEQ